MKKKYYDIKKISMKEYVNFIIQPRGTGRKFSKKVVKK